MLYLLLYLFVEIYISVQIASLIGPFWTFVEIVATAAYGFWIISNMHIQLTATMGALRSGEISLEEFEAMNLYSLVGALLLILPGFFTDFLGILLQFGVLSRFLAKRVLGLRSRRRKKSMEENDVIDVEIIER
ncbi:MAG: FxsA family protein [Epsilonproteobacteria bacterium]|nr:exclusion protein FxsA [Campylobacterota bacterium]NPA56540.1 FxsA family protein [Campylobacterota bacterium]